MRLAFRFGAAWQLVAALGLAAGIVSNATVASAQNQPLEITVAGANFEPLPIAIQEFEADGEDQGDVAQLSADLAAVVNANLESTGLFKIVPPEAYIASPKGFDVTPSYEDWRAINVDALVTGRVSRSGDGRLLVQFRVFDTQGEQQVQGLQLLAAPSEWRRIAHKVSDGIYTRLTGEGPYFDSRVVFVDETGPKGDRRKRLALMDQDGANMRFLQDTGALVLTPRFSPNDQSVLYISYDTGEPQVFLLNLDTGQREQLGTFPGMTFAPRFSPDGSQIVLSLSQDGNTDLYLMRLADRQVSRLTTNPAIDTSASFSPTGQELVFESDRGGSQQLYIAPTTGGAAQRISFGQGNYGTPVWSPRGDLIAFTKILGGRFHIGVMRTDGSEERLLSSSFLDEGPTFSPNGRVIMFFRESPGQNGKAELMSIDITGRNLRRVGTPNSASDPAWSPLRE